MAMNSSRLLGLIFYYSQDDFTQDKKETIVTI